MIPRLVEGFQVKYNTGGGQSLQTSYRVTIYETEGSVKPVHRPKRMRSEEGGALNRSGLDFGLGESSARLGGNVAVILAGEAGVTAEAVRRYKQSTKALIVEAATLGGEEPSIATAFGQCASKGASRVVCVPYVLSRDDKLQEFLRSQLSDCAATFTNISYSVTVPLGFSDALIDLAHRSVVQENALTLDLGTRDDGDDVENVIFTIDDGVSAAPASSSSALPSKKRARGEAGKSRAKPNKEE